MVANPNRLTTSPPQTTLSTHPLHSLATFSVSTHGGAYAMQFTLAPPIFSPHNTANNVATPAPRLCPVTSTLNPSFADIAANTVGAIATSNRLWGSDTKTV